MASGIRIKKLEGGRMPSSPSGEYTDVPLTLEFEYDAGGKKRVYVRVRNEQGKGVVHGYIPQSCVRNVRDFFSEQLGEGAGYPEPACERY